MHYPSGVHSLPGRRGRHAMNGPSAYVHGYEAARAGDPLEGQTCLVHPNSSLTPLQLERMPYQPEMILATAHIIRDDFIRCGHE